MKRLNLSRQTNVHNILYNAYLRKSKSAPYKAVTAKCKRQKRTDNLQLKNNGKPTHKTAHLQTTQTDTRPKFAKELFSSAHQY
jgi:hypothetical protein